jgi:hypothetical protein
MNTEELINDLILVSNSMDELWKYHPLNPDKIDIITEYDRLEKMKQLIELKLDSLRC